VIEADRVAEVNARVRKLLGLDFDGFTRSVLLPQGRFAEFLAGKPEERRKVLGELLRLDIYEQVRERAGQVARDAEKDAERLQRQIDEQYADATPQRLRQRRQDLRELQGQSQALRQEKTRLEAARSAAEAITKAAAEERRVAQELAAAKEQLADAEKTLREGEDELRALVEEIAGAEAEMAAAGYDPEVERRLSLTLPPARALEEAKAALAQKRGQEGQLQRRLEELLAQQQAVEKALVAVQAEAALREDEYESEKQRNMAMHLRRSLRAGQACPVCEQPVAAVPPAQHVALDAAARAWQEARQRVDQARQAVQNVEQAVALAQQGREDLRSQLDSLEEERRRWLSHLQSLEIQETISNADIEAALAVQSQAKGRYEAAQRQRDGLQGQRQSLADRYADARARVAGLRAVMGEKEAAVARARQALDQGRQQLLALAPAWPDIYAMAAAGKDVSAVLISRLQALESQLSNLDQAIGLARGDIQRIQQGIEAAKKLRRELEERRQGGTIARTLADLLRADRFVTWLAEAALAVLAEDGSRHLREISNRRYEFQVQGQEFLVVDHWNADKTRSARGTLSGGETFLASLALALALAERLPELGPGRRSSALESLFLDEGFGNLDEETLDVVASALESVMDQRQRMVGIITHLRPLAERMPVRINVEKSESGSSIYVD